ncbi:MAG: maleylpyruvate isomerase family mycothiol-dependent enzyme [Acidimicrobiales bacterium]
MDDERRRTFVEASGYLVAVVGQVPGDAWDRPGLGSWSVRELVAHANRAHTTVEEYLTEPRPPEPPGSDYFLPEAIAERGRQAVAALGDDPAAAVAADAARVVALVGATPLDATLGSPMGTMPLGQYLPSRVAELVVHGLDLAAATGVDVAPPPAALAGALAFVGRRAARRDGVAVLRAMTGRGDLPAGYSVY